MTPVSFSLLVAKSLDFPFISPFEVIFPQIHFVKVVYAQGFNINAETGTCTVQVFLQIILNKVKIRYNPSLISWRPHFSHVSAHR